MNTYTVIGLHPGVDWERGIRDATFVHDVRAATPTLAAWEAKRQMTTNCVQNPDGSDNIEIIAVFEGRHTNFYEPTLDTEEDEHSGNSEEGRNGDLHVNRRAIVTPVEG